MSSRTLAEAIITVAARDDKLDIVQAVRQSEADPNERHPVPSVGATQTIVAEAIQKRLGASFEVAKRILIDKAIDPAETIRLMSDIGAGSKIAASPSQETLAGARDLAHRHAAAVAKFGIDEPTLARNIAKFEQTALTTPNSYAATLGWLNSVAGQPVGTDRGNALLAAVSGMALGKGGQKDILPLDSSAETAPVVETFLQPGPAPQPF
jgi:hypothetical protein